MGAGGLVRYNTLHRVQQGWIASSHVVNRMCSQSAPVTVSLKSSSLTPAYYSSSDVLMVRDKCGMAIAGLLTFVDGVAVPLSGPVQYSE